MINASHKRTIEDGCLARKNESLTKRDDGLPRRDGGLSEE
jgi:hypothetical protein